MWPVDASEARSFRCPLVGGKITDGTKSFRSRRETRRRAREAVDAEKPKEILSEAAEEDVEPDAEAAEALREAAAEQTAEIAESAAHRARRLGRKNVTSEDVAQANERHQDREERGRRG